MPRLFAVLAGLLLVLPVAPTGAQPAKAADPPVAATIQTTLATASKQIRMFAFDGDPATYFASARDAGSADHLTLVFDKPVALKSVTATTGRPKGGDALDAGVLEVSADGKKFEELGKFEKGIAQVQGGGKPVLAVRLRPTADLQHPLAIREIVIDSEPAVVVFKYPVEFVIDVADAPDMKEWAEKVAGVCERAYQWINEELRSDGYKPPTVVTLALKKDYKGVAATGGSRITGSVSYFKSRPNDIGAMVHETVHVVQQYRVRGNPGWLVEGIADYLRFFKYEPGKLGKINPKTARYDGSYRVTAAFLAFITDKYDKELVRKLNQRMREGEYREELWKQFTGKTLTELNDEWRASLNAKTDAAAILQDNHRDTETQRRQRESERQELSSCLLCVSVSLRLSSLQARIDRFALEGQDAEDALVDAAQRLAVHEPFQGFNPQRELAQRQRTLGPQAA
jgi:hypothetical protein